MEHLVKLNKEVQCPICLLAMLDPVCACPGGHCICSSCMEEVRETAEKDRSDEDVIPLCPLCRKPLGDDILVHQFTNLIHSLPCVCFPSDAQLPENADRHANQQEPGSGKKRKQSEKGSMNRVNWTTEWTREVYAHLLGEEQAQLQNVFGMNRSKSTSCPFS
jgi:hypothetical protein